MVTRIDRLARSIGDLETNLRRERQLEGIETPLWLNDANQRSAQRGSATRSQNGVRGLPVTGSA